MNGIRPVNWEYHLDDYLLVPKNKLEDIVQEVSGNTEFYSGDTKDYYILKIVHIGEANEV